MSELYYLQDKRVIVGNSMMWWAVNDCGYTCDIRCARVWTKEELQERGYWEGYYKYQPWPKETVDSLVQWHVDVQDLTYKSKETGDYSKYPHTLKHLRPDLCVEVTP